MRNGRWLGHKHLLGETLAPRSLPSRAVRKSSDAVCPGLRDLHVNYAPVRVHDALVHHFGQRRVREDAMDEFLLGGLQVHGDHVALDELRHLGANHMGPEQLSRRLVEHRLNEAVGLTERDRLAVAEKGEAADLYVVALLLRSRLGEADARDLR